MGKYYDIVEGLKTAWIRWRNQELLKWMAIEFALGIALLVVVGGLLAAMIGTEVLIGLMSNTTGSTTQFSKALAGAIWPLLAVTIPLFIIYALVGFFFFTPRIMRAALVANGAKVPAKLPKMMDWLMLHIRLFLVNISCWYDKKLLIPAAVLFGLTILCTAIGIVAQIAFIGAIVFGILCWMCWIAAIVVHGMRTGFSRWMFLRGDGPESKMPITSNQLVHGQTLEVVIAKFGFSFVLWIVAMIVSFVRMILGLIPCVGLILDLAINLAFNFFSGAYTQSIEADIFLFFDKAGPASAAAAPKAKKK